MASSTPRREPPVYHYGAKAWKTPPDPTVDICFIHGLTGYRDETWTAAGETEPWPPTFLPDKFPHARLLTFGYDADVVRLGVASKDTPKTLAGNLLYALTEIREAGALRRPLVFVVHSLGGIICKKAVARSQHSADEKLASIAASLVGIVFMGTPHDGSDFAAAAGLLASSLGLFKSTNRKLLKALEKDSEMAADIDNEFWEAWTVLGKTTKAPIKIFCFFEILPLSAIKKCVVPEKSATYRQHPSQKIDANHHEMVKFRSEEDPGYKQLCMVLRGFLAVERAQSSSAPGSGPGGPSGGSGGSGGGEGGGEGGGIRGHTPDFQGGAHSSPTAPSPQSGRPAASPSAPQSSETPTQHVAAGGTGNQVANTGHGSMNVNFGGYNFYSAGGPMHVVLPQIRDQRNEILPTQHCHLAFRKNHNFVGREDKLDELRKLLFEAAHPIVALYGLGGVGKTQVANALAHWTQENKRDYSVFWVPALSKAGFEEAYTAIAKKLGIQRADNEDVKTLVCDHLNTEAAGKWLLVVDNADDFELVCGRDVPDSLDQYLPQQSSSGRVLVTTRTASVAQALSQTTASLDAFDLPHARQLAKKMLKPNLLGDDDSALDELLKELVYLPLAITQACAFINLPGLNMSVEEYLTLLRKTEADRVDLLDKEVEDSTRYKASRHAVASTWLVSFDHLRKTSPDAVKLLEFLSQIQPKAIPLSLLPPLKSGAATLGAISDLCAYSFVSKQNGMLDMHSLVHMAAWSWVDKSGRFIEVAHTALHHMRKIFPRDDHENRDTWTSYLPHALHILRDEKAGDSDDGFNLSFWTGRCLRVDGRIKEALQRLEYCKKWACESLPEDHPSRLASQHTLAAVYHANGQIQKAVDLLEHVVKVEEKLAEDHPDRLASQNELAKVYHVNGQIQKAVKLLEHVVKVQKKLAEDHPSRLASQHALAGTHYASGQVQKAVDLLEHVVKVQKKLAEDHPDRLASQHELARAYQASGQIQKAVELFEHVVKVREKLAKDHPSRLISQHGLARVYQDSGQIQKAVKLFEHVVKVREKLAEDHPFRLASQHGLAGVYRDSGQIQKAVELFEHVVKVREKLAEDHPSRLASQHGLAGVYRDSGQIQKAVELLEYVVKVREKLAEDHPDRLASQHELARAYQASGQIQKAVELLEHVVKVREKLAEDHRDRLVSQYVLARMLWDIGQKARAIKLLRHVVAVTRKVIFNDGFLSKAEIKLRSMEEEYSDI